MVWLSFADPERPKGTQFLGACLIGPAAGMLAAVALSHVFECNPGGEVQGMEIDREEEKYIPRGYVYRVLSRADIDAFEADVRALKRKMTS